MHIKNKISENCYKLSIYRYNDREQQTWGFNTLEQDYIGKLNLILRQSYFNLDYIKYWNKVYFGLSLISLLDLAYTITQRLKGHTYSSRSLTNCSVTLSFLHCAAADL